MSLNFPKRIVRIPSRGLDVELVDRLRRWVEVHREVLKRKSERGVAPIRARARRKETALCTSRVSVSPILAGLCTRRSGGKVCGSVDSGEQLRREES